MALGAPTSQWPWLLCMQSITITVSDPQKYGDGINAYITYMVSTKVRCGGRGVACPCLLSVHLMLLRDRRALAAVFVLAALHVGWRANRPVAARRCVSLKACAGVATASTCGLLV
jgi:hypothetical protein